MLEWLCSVAVSSLPDGVGITYTLVIHSTSLIYYVLRNFPCTYSHGVSHTFRSRNSNLNRPNTWEMADSGQIEPFEEFVLESLLVKRPYLVFELDAPAGLAISTAGYGDLAGVGTGWPRIEFQ